MNANFMPLCHEKPSCEVLRHHPSPLQPQREYGEDWENLIGRVLLYLQLPYTNASALEHILTKSSWALAVPVLQSLQQGVLYPLTQQSPQNSIILPKRNDWHSAPPDAGVQERLVSLNVLWSWLVVAHVLGEDAQLLQFRSEDSPAVWWLHFLNESSGDGKCGCKFGCNFFSTESCWGSWEWAPLWLLTRWAPLYKVRMILFFSSKGFLE